VTKKECNAFITHTHHASEKASDVDVLLTSPCSKTTSYSLQTTLSHHAHQRGPLFLTKGSLLLSHRKILLQYILERRDLARASVREATPSIDTTREREPQTFVVVSDLCCKKSKQQLLAISDIEQRGYQLFLNKTARIEQQTGERESDRPPPRFLKTARRQSCFHC